VLTNEFPSAVASAGDINGDGLDDVIVCATNSGVSYVVFGTASGFAADFDVATLDGSNGFVLASSVFNSGVGEPVASAGDVNGDGFDDLIVPRESGAGAYVVFGKSSGFSPIVDVLTLNGFNGFRIEGSGYGHPYGGSLPVAPAGDVNHDGFDDMVVGIPFD